MPSEVSCEGSSMGVVFLGSGGAIFASIEGLRLGWVVDISGCV